MAGLKDFATAILSLKQITKSLATRVSELRAQIDNLQRQRQEILSSGAARSDLKVAISALCQARAQRFREYAGAAMSPLVRSPAQLANLQRVDQLFTLLPGSTADGGRFSDDRAMVAHLEGLLCAVLGDGLIQTLHGVIDGTEYPREGLPMVRRNAEAEKLADQIGSLEIELAQLLEEAHAAGINLGR